MSNHEDRSTPPSKADENGVESGQKQKEMMGLDFPNRLLFMRSEGGNEVAPKKEFVFRIEFDTVLDANSARDLRRAMVAGRDQEAADIVIGKQIGGGAAERELIRLAFGVSTHVAKTPEKQEEKGLAEDKSAGATVPPPPKLYLEVAEDFGRNGIWRAAVRLAFDVDVNFASGRPTEDEIEQLRGLGPKDMRKRLNDLVSATPCKKKAIDAFTGQCP